MVDYGIAEPLEGESDKDWVFDSTSVHWIKKALRIHDDLDLDWVAVAIIIELQKEKENLLQENRHYRRQLKRFIGPDPR